MAGMSVQPYWELTFDADGDPDAGQRDALLTGVVTAGITDLFVFAHGWNSDRAAATSLYSSFFAPFPGLLAARTGVRAGFAGVVWPSMGFSDEPIPDFPHTLTAAGAVPATGSNAGSSGLTAADVAALAVVFPGQETTLARIAALLAERPDTREAFTEFVTLLRGLVAGPPGDRATLYAQDFGPAAARPAEPGTVPAMLTADPVDVCAAFTAALRETCGGTGPEERDFLGGGLKKLWDGAKEVLRQTTYYTMKGRAGTVGAAGLGPLIGRLAGRDRPPRVHLVGHSFGGRLVSFALHGLPDGAAGIASVTLLEGAFSHYAFADRLPFDASRGGALAHAYRRVSGPVVACFSSHDMALGVMYPLASRLAHQDDSLLGLDDGQWGAIGHDGFQAVDGSPRLLLTDALRGPFPTAGCVSVDVSAVVNTGGPPAGAHSDICHEELARVVLSAGRLLP